jgi:hypothetical protein
VSETWTYLDVGAARIQRYLSRTHRLKGLRGASGWLSWFTDRNELKKRIEPLASDGVEVNRFAGDADGVVPLRLPPRPDAEVESIARRVMAEMQAALPGIELTAAWGTGEHYVDVYRDTIKAQRDSPRLTSGPPGADFPSLESCAECRVDAAVATIDIHEDRGRAVCADCYARYEGLYRRLGLKSWMSPYRGENELLRSLGLNPDDNVVQHFEELARLGDPDGNRNHVATVSIDGNAMGAFFDRVAKSGVVDLKERVSRSVSKATRESLVAATVEVMDPSRKASAKVPVIPHVLGGDDLLVSVVADHAWRFVLAYLDEFARRVREIKNVPQDLYGQVPPSASAGVVFAHLTFPFRRATELAEQCQKHAKRAYSGAAAAVSWLDVTREGETRPAARSAWTLADLMAQRPALDVLREVEPSGRATLERLIDTDRPAVSAARLREHARRLEREHVLDPFLTAESKVERVADALAIARWWR